MRNLLLFLLLLLSAHLTAQTVIVGGGNMCKVNGDPDLNVKLAQQDQRYECSIAWDTLGNKFYVYRASDPAGSRWDELAVSGTTLTAGTGILISGDTIYSTGDPSSTNELQALVVAANAITLSGSGGSATIAGAGGNVVTTSGTTITVTAPTPNGAETKVTQGTGIAVGGIGTTGSPYVVTNTAPDQTVTIAGAGGNNVTGAYPNFTVTGTPANGAETKVNEGTGIHVTGLGTTVSPYVVNSTITQADGTETKVTAGTNVTVSGTGTPGNPYVVNSSGGGGGAALPAQQIGYGNTSSIVSDAAFTRLLNTVSIGASDTTGRLTFNRPVDSKYAIVFSGNGSTAADRFIKIKKDPILTESIISDWNMYRISIPNHGGGGNNQVIGWGFNQDETGLVDNTKAGFSVSMENNYSNDGAGTDHPYVFEMQIGQVTFPSGDYRRPISIIAGNTEADKRGALLLCGDYYAYKRYDNDFQSMIFSPAGKGGYGNYDKGFTYYDSIATYATINNYPLLKQNRGPAFSNFIQSLIYFDGAGVARIGDQSVGQGPSAQFGNSFSVGRTGEVDQVFNGLGESGGVGALSLDFGKAGFRYRNYNFQATSEIVSTLANTGNTGGWSMGLPSNKSFYLYNQTAAKKPFIVGGTSPDYALHIDNNGNIGLGTFANVAKLTITSDSATTKPMVRFSNPVGISDQFLIAYNPNGNLSGYPGDVARSLLGKYWLKVSGSGTMNNWAELLTTASTFDPDTTNELQTISRTANTLTLSKGGGTVSINRPPVTGTTNFIPKITDTPDSLANSVLYESTSGKIGLNTTMPKTALDIIDNTSVTTFSGINNAGLRVSGASGSGKYSLLQFAGNVSNPIGQIGLKQTDDGTLMEFGTSNNYGAGITNTAMRIDYDGDVGVGLPAGVLPSQPLHVGGNVRITGAIYDNANSSGTSGQYPASTGSGFVWNTLPDASNTNELQTLSIVGSSVTLSNGGGTVVVPGTSYTGGTGIDITGTVITNKLSTGVSGGQSVVGGTAASNNLTISSTANATKGNILIGSSYYDEVNNRFGLGIVPSAGKLHVLGGNAAALPSLAFQGYQSNAPLYTMARGIFGSTTSAVLAALTWNCNGADIAGLGFQSPDANNGRLIFSTRSAGTFAERVTISADGSMGVNTTAPSAKTHIVGSGATSSTHNFRTTNSAGVVGINSRDDGAVSIGSSVPQTGYALTTVGDAYFTANAVVAGAAAGQTANTLWGRNTAGFLIPLTFNPAHITLTGNVLDVTGANPVVAMGNNANVATSTLSGITTYRVDQGLGAVAWKGDTLVSNINAQLDNWIPGGWGNSTVGVAGKTIIEVTLTGNQVLTGVDNPIDGRFLIIRNLDATDKLTVKNQSTSSTGANRFSLVQDYDILPGQQATFQYSVLKGSWILWGHQDATVVYYIEGQTGTTFDLDAASGAIKDVDGNTITDYFPPNLDAVTITKNGLTLARTGTATTRGYSINTTTQVITFAVAALVTDNYTIKLEK